VSVGTAMVARAYEEPSAIVFLTLVIYAQNVFDTMPARI
jgi:hypothetical protein